jgi:flagellar basal body-associated protein FliL
MTRSDDVTVTTRTTNMDLANYFRSIVVLLLVMAIFFVISVFGIYALFLKQADSQKLLLDCTDRRRSHSPCQEYANERTGQVVSTFRDIVSAYVLCADKLNGDQKIKNCVSDKLKAGN